LLQSIESEFSGEEGHGAFLDLISFHLECKTKDHSSIDYLSFLQIFDQSELLEAQSNSWLYRLERYLYIYIERTMPLFDLKQMYTDLLQEYSASEFYCKVCNRAFSKKTVFEAHLQSKRHLQKEQQQVNEKKNSTEHFDAEPNQAPHSFCHSTSSKLLVFLIQNYMKTVLDEKRLDTIANIQRKASLTLREREAEMTYEEESTSLTEDKSPALIYNPLKLPLDWDGKPIPYWLWRLHGLGTEFPCEICGGYRYLGRKAFDRHFQEWRHLHGLKCIGITASGKAYYGITTIQDALMLAEKLRQQQRAQSFRPETMEEYEDEEGNVFSRKTFEDLKRQGII
jgi:splicing factor 3A subunit 3